MGDRGHRRTPTVAEFLGSLVAGDPCPCCGEVLQSGQAHHSPAALVCRSCGCEVETEEWPFRVGSSEGFCLAA